MMSISAIVPSDNAHAKKTRENLQLLKDLTANLDGWELTLDQDNVKLYHKPDTTTPPLVRGDTVLTDLPPGCTPLAVATVATLPGCRRICKIVEYTYYFLLTASPRGRKI